MVASGIDPKAQGVTGGLVAVWWQDEVLYFGWHSVVTHALSSSELPVAGVLRDKILSGGVRRGGCCCGIPSRWSSLVPEPSQDARTEKTGEGIFFNNIGSAPFVALVGARWLSQDSHRCCPRRGRRKPFVCVFSASKQMCNKYPVRCLL